MRPLLYIITILLLISNFKLIRAPRPTVKPTRSPTRRPTPDPTSIPTSMPTSAPTIAIVDADTFSYNSLLFLSAIGVIQPIIGVVLLNIWVW